MLVFRDGRRQVEGPALLSQFVGILKHLCGSGTISHEAILDALLRAGELECALADSASANLDRIASITDALAENLVGGNSRLLVPEWRNSLSQVSPPDTVYISQPEGFAYYALHPLQYVALTHSLPIASGAAAVVGIRTIGTTLSAVVIAGLRRRGVSAERTTVRPEGHPFNRVTQFSPQQKRWIAQHRARSAAFLVVDEGPGLSGSSFLSVGDALLEAGVSRTKISFLCGSQPDSGRLRARDAAARWTQFRSYCVRPWQHLPQQFGKELGGGRWREHFLRSTDEWPASWTAMERAKFLSSDELFFCKFEGFGRFGTEIYERARVLAAAGFAPVANEICDGYVSYHLINGRPANKSDLTSALLERIADYCALRAREFRVSDDGTEALTNMVRWNLQEEFGAGAEETCGELEVRFPVLVDGRMLPHEWLLTAENPVKTDGVSHGDDHFFPGPTDIAWDLAGTIVEWDLDPQSSEYLLRHYQMVSGDDPGERLPAFLQAYAAFRMGYCKMAAESVCGRLEGDRLWSAYRQYREFTKAYLPQGMAA